MHDRAHKEGCVYPQPLVFTLLGHQRDFFSHLLELLLCSSIYIYILTILLRTKKRAGQQNFMTRKISRSGLTHTWTDSINWPLNLFYQPKRPSVPRSSYF